MHNPTRNGHTFLGWTRDGETTPSTTVTIPAGTTGNLNFTAHWQEHVSGGQVDDDYTLRYVTNGGDTIQPETKGYSWTKKYEELPVPSREGYIFEGWYLDKSLTDLVAGDLRVNRSTVTLYAKWREDLGSPDRNGISRWLNTKDHGAYLNGYKDGTFGPDDNMTRAEVAQMFYNLLLDREVPITVSFTDVPAGAWYEEAVNTLASLDILRGIGNNQFAPDRPITRAQFTVIAVRFLDAAVSGDNIFSDVGPDDWFYDEVVSSIQYGWITGYEDGTFRPDHPITRAQVTTIVNRMLGRCADPQYVDGHGDELRQFSDVPEGYWAYYQIVEATTPHDYVKSGTKEKWTRINNV